MQIIKNISKLFAKIYVVIIIKITVHSLSENFVNTEFGLKNLVKIKRTRPKTYEVYIRGQYPTDFWPERSNSTRNSEVSGAGIRVWV